MLFVPTPEPVLPIHVSPFTVRLPPACRFMVPLAPSPIRNKLGWLAVTSVVTVAMLPDDVFTIAFTPEGTPLGFQLLASDQSVLVPPTQVDCATTDAPRQTSAAMAAVLIMRRVVLVTVLTAALTGDMQVLRGRQVQVVEDLIV